MITELEAIEYIKDDLGLGIVNLELDDKTIKRNISRALLVMSSYYSVPTYKTIDVTTTSVSGGYIPLEEIDEDGISVVTAVYPADTILRTEATLLGIGMLYMNVGQKLDAQINAYSNIVQKMALLESILGRGAKLVGDKLYIDNYYSKVTIAYIPAKLHISKITDGDWLRWALEYSIALSKRQLAQTRGKYVVDSNPAKTNAETLLNEANEKLVALEEDLALKGTITVIK